MTRESRNMFAATSGPCRRCGCTRIGKFCSKCGAEFVELRNPYAADYGPGDDQIERRRRPRKRPCWLLHRWEYLDCAGDYRACTKCGLVQRNFMIVGWRRVPGETIRKK